LLQSDDANVYTLYGSGTTNPFKFFWKVMDIMEERAKVPLFMTYRAVGSITGQKEFTGTAENSYEPLNHFGAGDIPLTQARYDEMNPVASAPSKMLHIPFLVGPIAVFHSVPAGELPAGGIELDACLLSKILRRVITTWDDPAIKALNPDLKVPVASPSRLRTARLVPAPMRESRSISPRPPRTGASLKPLLLSVLSVYVSHRETVSSPWIARTSITRQCGYHIGLSGFSSAFHDARSLFNLWVLLNGHHTREECGRG